MCAAIECTAAALLATCLVLYVMEKTSAKEIKEKGSIFSHLKAQEGLLVAVRRQEQVYKWLTKVRPKQHSHLMPF